VISSVSMSSLSVSVSQVSAGGCSKASAAGGTCGGSRTGDRADISGPGKMFAELKQLASQDPAKFKQVATDIASKLKAAAGGTDSTAGSDGSTTGPAASANKFLTELAAKFDSAAQTGDVSGLQLSGGHHRPRAITGGRDGGPISSPNQQDPTAVIGGRDGGPIRVPNQQDPGGIVGGRDGGPVGTYNQRGQAAAVAPAGGADLKALFDDISKEVTDALSSTAKA
jgi:hypothetical protein